MLFFFVFLSSSGGRCEVVGGHHNVIAEGETHSDRCECLLFSRDNAVMRLIAIPRHITRNKSQANHLNVFCEFYSKDDPSESIVSHQITRNRIFNLLI
jgi:hypothetical protein